MDAALLEKLAKITPEEQSLLDGQALDKSVYTSGDKFVVGSEKMLERGKLISVRPHTRFTEFPPHTHNYVEIMYMCSGATTHVINGRHTLTLHKGEILLLNQHVSHAIHRAGQQDVAVNFIVLPQFFDSALEMIGTDNVLGQFLMGSLQQAGGDISYLHFGVADVPMVQNLIENLVRGIVEPQPNSRRIVRVTMGLLFLQLLNCTQRMGTASGQGNNALVVEALREIEENYPAANLSAIAAGYGVSVPYLSLLIKQATGATFKTLLQQKRLAKAAQLLQTSHLGVGDVIAAVGYDNTSYFYRIFKQQYGVVPKEYRRINQQKI